MYVYIASFVSVDIFAQMLYYLPFNHAIKRIMHHKAGHLDDIFWWLQSISEQWIRAEVQNIEF